MGALPILAIGLNMSTLFFITHDISMSCLLLTTRNSQLQNRPTLLPIVPFFAEVKYRGTVAGGS